MIKFYFPYHGTKRNDMKYIKDAINLNKIKRIVEPFAGSCAFSLYCYRELDFKGEIILNDIDENLINFYKDVKENGSEKYFKFVIDKYNDGKITMDEHLKLLNDKDKNLFNWFYFKRYDGKFRRQIEGSKQFTKEKYEKNKDVIKSLDEFFKDDKIKLFCGDYLDIFNKYNDKQTLFYLDPPFFASYNSGYSKFYKNQDENKNVLDNTKIYIDMIELLKSKSRTIISINNNSLIRYLYKDYIFKDFNKIYQADKKKEGQLILKN